MSDVADRVKKIVVEHLSVDENKELSFFILQKVEYLWHITIEGK